MNSQIMKYGPIILTLAFIAGVFGLILSINEYEVLGINAANCDSREALIFMISSFVVLAVGAYVYRFKKNLAL